MSGDFVPKSFEGVTFGARREVVEFILAQNLPGPVEEGLLKRVLGELTMVEIALVMGVSKQRIEQILLGCFDKLRRNRTLRDMYFTDPPVWRWRNG